MTLPVNRFYEGHRLPLRIMYTALMRIHATGVGNMPQTGGVVLVSNHLTNLDPWLLGILFPRQLFFMAKEELYKFKPLGWYLHQAGTFEIKRGKSDRTAIRYAESLLRQGGVVMVFPEGHRSDSGSAQAARAGAVLLATRTNSPIVPAGITGTENFRLKSVPGRSRLGMFSRPRVTVNVGPPIYLDRSAKGGGKKQAADLVMRKIIELLPPAYHGVYASDSEQTAAGSA